MRVYKHSGLSLMRDNVRERKLVTIKWDKVHHAFLTISDYCLAWRYLISFRCSSSPQSVTGIYQYVGYESKFAGSRRVHFFLQLGPFSKYVVNKYSKPTPSRFAIFFITFYVVQDISSFDDIDGIHDNIFMR